MKISIQKWGNGAAVRLQRPLLQQIHCEIGETLEVEVVNGGLFLKPAREPEFSLEELLSTCTPDNVRLSNEDKEWLQDSPKGREL
jgi:antitoxin component of MazEF toxin-antitoxin module